jgi:predicted nucleic-acid-binding protein
MLGIDTNVLIRYLVGDHREQFLRAQTLIREQVRQGEPVFVSLMVLMESEWVLRSRYGLAKGDIADSFAGLLQSVDVRFESESTVETALYTWRNSGADFADCLIGARHQEVGCSLTATFDARAARLPGFISA